MTGRGKEKNDVLEILGQNQGNAEILHVKEPEMAEDSYVAVDVETTGLNPKVERIIEIGMVKVEKGTIVDEKTTLINPYRLLDPQVEHLTGITDKMLADAPGIEGMIKEYLDFCQDFVLLGHRVLFDYSFLKRAALNQGFSFEKNGIDTLVLCRKFMPCEEKKNLSSACAYYQVKQEGIHRALEDARSAARLYEKLKERYFMEAPGIFSSKPLIYKIKREQPASKRQKEVLRELVKYHKIDLTVQIDSMTRNEISRLTDKIISQYGRIIKR